MQRTDLYLSDAQYLNMLNKLKALIEGGLKLELDDCNDFGNKHTHASWGQCTEKNWDEDALAYPDKPFLGSKPHDKGQFCPFDSKIPAKGTKLRNRPSGCFFRCLLFQAKKGEMPNREKALILYRDRIHQAEMMIENKKELAALVALIESTCQTLFGHIKTKEEALAYVDGFAYTISMQIGNNNLPFLKAKIKETINGLTW